MSWRVAHWNCNSNVEIRVREHRTLKNYRQMGINDCVTRRVSRVLIYLQRQTLKQATEMIMMIRS